MVLRVGQIDRIGLACNQPDQPFVGAQHGLVHRRLVQAFGGVELERAVDAQHVDGADLRHHVGGDQHHDLVQALLRADRLRHHFAKPAQQHARTAERATHDVSLGSAQSAEATGARSGVARPEPIGEVGDRTAVSKRSAARYFDSERVWRQCGARDGRATLGRIANAA